MTHTTWANSLYNWIFPSCCLMCKNKVMHATQPLCQTCLSDIPLFSLPNVAPNLLIRPDVKRLFSVTHFDSLFALCWYQSPVSNWLTQLKFNNRIYYRFALIQLIQYQLALFSQHPDWSLPDLVIFLPLHNVRLKVRGFNQVDQVWRLCVPAELITDDLLHRNRHTQAQTSLNATQRKINLKSAFSCQYEITGKKVVIVDDVVTTGSTVNEASLCLKKSGAKQVSVWTTCLTPVNLKL